MSTSPEQPAARAPVPGVALYGLAYLLLSRHLWFVNDDAYISFRYARNLAAGLGLRYNLGDGPPVEGYSNFLWVLVAAAIDLVGGSMPVVMPILSCLCGLALLLLLERRLRGPLGVSGPIAVLSVTVLALFPPFAAWGSSGLETMPFTLLLFLTFDRLVLTEKPDWLGGTAAGFLMSLTRLEGIAWVVVILVLAVVRQLLRERRRLRPLLYATLGIAVLFGGYYAWRYSYFGEPVPNTAYAKIHGASSYDRGLRYLGTYLTTFLTPLLLLPGCFVAMQRKRWALGSAVATMAIAVPTYAVVVSGDFMAMGRLFVPGLPFMAITTAWLLQALAGPENKRLPLALAGGVGVIVVGLLPIANVHIVPDGMRGRFHFRFNAARPTTEWEALLAQRKRPLTWRAQGAALQRYADARGYPDDAIVCVGGMGAIGWECSRQIFDIYGLVVPEVARREVAADEPRRSPGHDKEVELEFMLRFEPHIVWSWWLPDDRERALGMAEAIMPGLRAYPAIWKTCAPDLVRVEHSGGSNYLLLIRRAEPSDAAPGRRWNDFLQRLNTEPIEQL